MRIDDWRTAQLKEIDAWAESLDKIITPETVIPRNLHDYPNCRAVCEKLRSICQRKAKDLEDKVIAIQDQLMEEIERERYVLKLHPTTGMPEYKKLFPSAPSRERELRKRLAAHETYGTLEKERTDWELMVKDWRTHADRLRQEMRVLEADYLHNGAQSIDRTGHYKLEKK